MNRFSSVMGPPLAAARVKRAVSLACGAAAWLAVVPALAQQAPLGTHQKNVRLEAGLRTQFVSSDGLDAFSENDVVPQLTAAASYAFYARDRLSLAGTLTVDLGELSDHARSFETSLGLYRFAIGPELRYHVLQVAAATLRLSPTVLHTAAQLGEGDAELVKNSWSFGFDATAGAAIEVYGYADGASTKPRLWLVLEGGYGWASTSELVLEPDNEGAAPLRLEALNLGDLSVSGPLFRIAAAVSF